jgi:hypothetical protein
MERHAAEIRREMDAKPPRTGIDYLRSYWICDTARMLAAHNADIDFDCWIRAAEKLATALEESGHAFWMVSEVKL